MSRLAHAGRLAVLAGLTAQGGLVHAQSSRLPEGWQCDGSFSLLSGSDTSASCSGSLTLTGITLTAEHSITLQSDQNLGLLGASLSAPSITLIAGSTMTVDSHSTLNFAGTGQPPSQDPLASQWGATLMVGNHSYAPPISMPASGLTIGSNATVVTGDGLLELTPVPEPSTWVLSMLGLGTAAVVARRRTARRV
jgi:hypothetical protein